MAFAPVYQSTEEIRTQDVDPSVFSILTAPRIKLAFATSVTILASVLVDRTLFAMSSTISPCAVALQALVAMLSSSVPQSKVLNVV